MMKWNFTAETKSKFLYEMKNMRNRRKMVTVSIFAYNSISIALFIDDNGNVILLNTAVIMMMMMMI